MVARHRRQRPPSVRLQRPPQELLQFERLPLARVHIVFLLICTAYIGLRYPSSLGPALLVGSAGILAELAPGAWRRFFFAEMVAVVVGLVSLWWCYVIDGVWPTPGSAHLSESAFHGWVRLLVMTWLLVPSRPGFLRFLAMLIGVEILIADRIGDPATAPLAQIALVPIGLAALACDTWLRVGCARTPDALVGRGGSRSPWRWILPAVLATAGLAAVATVLVIQMKQHVARGGGAGGGGQQVAGQRLPMTIGIDEPQWRDQDPSVVAKLKYEDLPPDTYYLRAFTAPEPAVRQGSIVWSSERPYGVDLADQHVLHPGHPHRMAVLEREADFSDMVYRPDGCNMVMLYNMRADGDGNLMREDLGTIARYYEVDIGSHAYPPETYATVQLKNYTYLPERLTYLVRDRVPQIADWHRQPSLTAAEGIKAWLHARTSYAIDDLPPVADEYADGLRTFLFGESAVQRRGHCQYYATAATVLLRAAGHPARPVVGFTSDEVHEEGVVFRTLGAHAWVEVHATVDGEPQWFRFDPTPAGHLDLRRRGVDLGGDPFANDLPFQPAVEMGDPIERVDQQSDRSWWPVAIGVVLLTVLALLVLGRRRRDPEDRRRVLLQKQTEDLVAVALVAGIPVDQHTTLTVLCRELTERSGVDLHAHLAEHLAARFGDGPLPRPWPLTDLRRALRDRAAVASS